MRGRESASNRHRASVPNPAVSRRNGARFEDQPRLGDDAEAVSGGPPTVYEVLDVLIGDLDCGGLGSRLENPLWLPSEE